MTVDVCWLVYFISCIVMSHLVLGLTLDLDTRASSIQIINMGGFSLIYAYILFSGSLGGLCGLGWWLRSCCFWSFVLGLGLNTVNSVVITIQCSIPLLLGFVLYSRTEVVLIVKHLIPDAKGFLSVFQTSDFFERSWSYNLTAFFPF